MRETVSNAISIFRRVTSSSKSSNFGKNSCNGGSIKRMMTGNPFLCAVEFRGLTGVGTVDVTVAEFHTPQTVLTPTKVLYTFTVPEPATAMLIAPVIVLFALLRWKRTRGNFGAS